MARKDPRSAAKRAAKKHEKAVKRKRVLAERAQGPSGPRPPDEAWRPAREGIEGLARRVKAGRHAAASLAEDLYRKHGRKDALAAWLPSRVAVMEVPTVVRALAERGVVTDEAGFGALAAEHLSSQRLAEVAWLPLLAPDHDVHDRDFCAVAAERLWRAWTPGLRSDEQVEDALVDAELALWDLGDDAAADRLVRLWEGFAPGEAAPRLERAGLAERFVTLAGDALESSDAAEELDIERVRALLAATEAFGDRVVVDDATRFKLAFAKDEVAWALGEGDGVVDRMLGEAAGEPGRLLHVADMVLSRIGPTDAQRERVRDALVVALPSFDPALVEVAEGLVADLGQALSRSRPA